MAKDILLPFLKWPGGKRWLMEKNKNIFPKDYNRYFEPFLGGGAAFFYLSPSEAILSDINGGLINLYIAMRDEYESLAQHMRKHQIAHCTDYYYQMRSASFDDPIQEASRFLYLNRTCYNGMYRVNKHGHFNVPIGTKTNCIYDIEKFQDYSSVLKQAKIVERDFSETISEAENGDLIFADPPYATPSKDNFTKYNDALFTWGDQERLCEVLSAAKNRGVIIVATNAYNNGIKQMYIEHGFFVKTVQRYSVIAGKSTCRKKQKELLISSMPLSKR